MTLALSLFVVAGFAQRPLDPKSSKDLRVENATLTKQGDEAVLSFEVYTNKSVKWWRQLMIATPELEYGTQEANSTKFEVATAGKAGALRRAEKKSGEVIDFQRAGRKSRVLYTTSFPYSVDMVDAELKIVRTLERGKLKREIPSIYVPLTIDASMIPAKEEPVKVVTPKVINLDITLDDNVTFKVGKSILDMTKGSNKESADKVIAEIKRIMATEGAQITDIAIMGFASPEGSESINNRLSNERAVSFMEIILPQTGLDKWAFKVEQGGENWAGLESLIEDSELKTKSELIKIIRSDKTPTEKQASLERMAAYNHLFTKMYPVLRNAGNVRITYTITK